MKVDQDSRENQILDAAEIALSRFGAKRMNMDDVSEIVGLSRPAIYQYFRSKKGLVIATLTRLHEENFKRIERGVMIEEKTPNKILFALRTREYFLSDLANAARVKNWFLDESLAETRELLARWDETYFQLIRDRLAYLGLGERNAERTAQLLVILAKGIRESASSREELSDLLNEGVKRIMRPVNQILPAAPQKPASVVTPSETALDERKLRSDSDWEPNL